MEIAEAEHLPSMLFSEFKVNVPWGHIAGKSSGDPSAEPVLCLHGKQDNANSFDTLLPLLPSSFFYVTIDLPSHGLSSHLPPGKPLNLMEFALAVDRVIQHFGWNQVQLLGHSLGAVISILYTSLFPKKITKIIALDPIFELQFSTIDLCDFIVSRHEKLLKLEKSMSSKSPPKYSTEEALRRLVQSRPTNLTEEVALRLFSRGVKLNNEGYSFSADQRIKLTVPVLFTKEQLLELYSRITCPLLVFRARESLNFNMHNFDDFHIMFTATLGKKYQYKVVEGSHDVHMLAPEKVADDVTRFLSMRKSAL